MPNLNSPVHILLVEDNPADVRLAQEAFKDIKMDHQLHVVKDGVEAMEYLYRQGEFQNAQRPDLILLDLNLPRKNGHEVLKEVKEDDRFFLIPVIVLTTSRASLDILKAYKLHANSYIVKPIDIDGFWAIAKSVESFWLNISTLPNIQEPIEGKPEI